MVPVVPVVPPVLVELNQARVSMAEPLQVTRPMVVTVVLVTVVIILDHLERPQQMALAVATLMINLAVEEGRLCST